jgi:hypothetical protein
MKKVVTGAFSVAVIAIFLFLLLVALTRAQTPEIVASGGTFALEKTALAGGGLEKEMAPLSENGTVGQAIAGGISSGGPYSVHSGFWTPEILVPTAAHVSVSGRIVDHAGNGIMGAEVKLMAPSGDLRRALSSSFGYYAIAEVEAGVTYMLSVSAKRYTFEQPTRVIQVADEIADADFVTNPLQ